MHWYWIDRFVEFKSGQYAKAVKTISLSEGHLHDHFPGYPVMPASLVIEGIAQTGGLLVCEYSHFTEKVILAKVPKTRFFSDAVPGDRLTYTTKVEYIKKDGAMVTATSHKDGQLHAEMEIVFAHLNGQYQGRPSFDATVFRDMMRVLGGFEVGAREPRETVPTLPLPAAFVDAPVRPRAATA